MDSKSVSVKRIILFIVFYLVVLCIHLNMDIISDDRVNIDLLGTIDFHSVKSAIINRWYSNGKVFTDGIGFCIYLMPLILWKFLDPLVYVLISLLLCKLFTNCAYKDIVLVNLLVLLFPFNYLQSAGYIMTTVNYIYPLLAILVILYNLKLHNKGKMFIKNYIAIFFALLICMNQDQYAISLILGLIMLSGYFCFYNSMIKKQILSVTLLSIMVYVCEFFIPGHLFRMQSKGELVWLPQYEGWNTGKKIVEGYTTTISHLFINGVGVYLIFIIFLAMLAYNNRMVVCRYLGNIPLLLFIIQKLIGTEKMLTYYEYSCGLPDLNYETGGIIPLVSLVLTSISIISIILFFCLEKNISCRGIIILLLVIGAVSREMMGFSCTLYASSFRTFTVFIFSFIGSIILIYKEITNKKLFEENLLISVVATAWIFSFI